MLIDADDVTGLADALKRRACEHERYNQIALRNAALHKYGASAFLDRMERIYTSALNGDTNKSAA